MPEKILQVYNIVKKIPRGKVASYKEIARKARIHPRAVARILARNYDKNIPCHRVVYNDGKLGGYNRGIKNKIKLLEKEGVEIEKGKVNRKYKWKDL